METTRLLERDPIDHAISRRNRFITIVYAKVFGMYICTILLAMPFLYIDSLREWASKQERLMFFMSIGTLATLVVLTVIRRTRNYNYLVLVVFTLFQAVLIGVLSAAFHHSYFLWSITISAVSFSLISVASIKTKRDLSQLQWLVGWLFTVFMLMNNVHKAVKFTDAFQLVKAILSTGVYIVYLLHDIQYVTMHLDTSETIVAAIQLYLDLVNLVITFVNTLTFIMDVHTDHHHTISTMTNLLMLSSNSHLRNT